MNTVIYFGTNEHETSDRILNSLKKIGFNILYAHGFEPYERYPESYLASLNANFLFSFTPVLVSKVILDSIQTASINFHTAPPAYPGRAACSRALLDQALEFGVTAHLMDEKFDHGKIVQVIRFPISVYETAFSLHKTTLNYVELLVNEVAEKIRDSGFKAPEPIEESWGKMFYLNQLDALMEIQPDESKESVERKIRAFEYPGKKGVYVRVGGRRFTYLEGPPQ